MKTKIEIGSYVIINQTDVPCAKSVAQVYAIEEQGVVKAKYLSKNSNIKECSGSYKHVTCISDFGVFIRFQDNYYICSVEKKGVATNIHRERRYWQENSCPMQPLRK